MSSPTMAGEQGRLVKPQRVVVEERRAATHAHESAAQYWIEWLAVTKNEACEVASSRPRLVIGAAELALRLHELSLLGGIHIRIGIHDIL